MGSVIALIVFTTFVGSGGPMTDIGPMLIGLGILAVALVIGYQVAYYRRFTYAVTTDTLDIASGVISRQRREIPLRRIQNVDISQGLFQRALGIAAVDFETAGGGSTEAQLRYVSIGEARRLQDVIRGHDHADDATSSRATRDTGDLLFALDERSLLVLSLLSFDLRVFSLVQTAGALASPALAGILLDGPIASRWPVIVLAIGGFLASGWLIGAAVTFTRYFGFQLTRVEDELRYERGLLQRYSGTIPLEKIQTLTVRENVLMRSFGYAALSIETAGYGGGEEPSGGSEAAIPLDTRPAVLDLARSLEGFGEPAFASPPERTRNRYVRRYRLIALGIGAILAGIVWALGLDTPWYGLAGVVILVGVGLAKPAGERGYESRAWSLSSEYAVTRNGWWRRRTAIVPIYRVQTVIDRRTIFQRRWDLATVEFDTAGSLSLGGATGRAVDIDAATAASIRTEAAAGLQASLVERRRPSHRRDGSSPAA